MVSINRNNAKKGQVIVFVALVMVGLIAIVGLMTDGGMLLIEYGKLKRATDAAAISASQQFRRGFTGADLSTAAQNFLRLNSSAASNINVYRCKIDPNTNILDTTADGTLHDDNLCTLPRRKLVRVEATRTVQFGFMRVLGIESGNITTSAVGEAASIDLVLIIDTSGSMSYETYASGDNNRLDHISEDPSVCNGNVATPCAPLIDVKNVADEFIDNMFFPYDRVAVVAMTNQQANATNRNPVAVLHLSDSEANVRSAIAGLRVFQPPACDWNNSLPASGPCISYAGANPAIDCIKFRTTGDVSSCNSSNIGGAFYLAATEYSLGLIREDSLWVAVALFGGPANATDAQPGYPDGLCPSNTWNSPINPYCRDASVSTKHNTGDPLYDADDYARDAAYYLADPVNGQGVTVFTIGLGYQIRNQVKGDANAGESLLQYAATTAGGASANHGEYFYSPDSSGLAAIFSKIADNIFTRISR